MAASAFTGATDAGGFAELATAVGGAAYALYGLLRPCQTRQTQA